MSGAKHARRHSNSAPELLKQDQSCDEPELVHEDPELKSFDVTQLAREDLVFRSSKTLELAPEVLASQSSKYRVLGSLFPEMTDVDSEFTILNWKKIRAENLRIDYTRILTKSVADKLFGILENEVIYYTDELTKVKVFGKWHKLPRKQVAYGDPGLTYTFSGVCIPATNWLPILQDLRRLIGSVTGHEFNFVLINRYKDGFDHIGEHRDNEKDLSPLAPIASISLGQERDFVLKHADFRSTKSSGQVRRKKMIDPITIPLEHGSLLLMKHPTNQYWYHSLPVRKRCKGPRINLTFRQINI